MDELLIRIGEGLRDEREEVSRLASLARRCEVTHPDARAETLVELMYKLRAEENNPQLKFLVFTEFIPTQEMLREFLEIRGFSVVYLNGSMTLTERLEAQRNFAEYADVLVSTEAGGEGINLQFCHIVFNYDLPWNPMRVEQRIGRIDRIGQKHPVKVYNLVFDNTVEHRVREVLEEKLLIILEEFGVDKLSDILDAIESKTVVLKTPEESYSLIALIGTTERYMISRIWRASDNEVVATSRTTKLSLIAGKYVGKDDPVCLVRGQSGFPATLLS